MAVISTVTIGSDTFSVYALTADPNADTDSFWNVRLGPERTAWEAATEDDQNRAMVVSADWIDRALIFTGDETVDGQPRAWPRDGASCSGEAVPDGTTPDDIFNAQAWLAGSVLADNETASSSGEGSNVKSVGAGSARVAFFRPTTGTATDVRLPQVAHDYTRCYTEAGQSSGLAAPSITGLGDSQPASSTECDDELSGGFA